MNVLIILVVYPDQCSNHRIMNEADRNRNTGGCGRNGDDACYGDYTLSNSTSPGWQGPG